MKVVEEQHETLPTFQPRMFRLTIDTQEEQDALIKLSKDGGSLQYGTPPYWFFGMLYDRLTTPLHLRNYILLKDVTK